MVWDGLGCFRPYAGRVLVVTGKPPRSDSLRPYLSS
jgi:hypothetical protein